MWSAPINFNHNVHIFSLIVELLSDSISASACWKQACYGQM